MPPLKCACGFPYPPLTNGYPITQQLFLSPAPEFGHDKNDDGNDYDNEDQRRIETSAEDVADHLTSCEREHHESDTKYNYVSHLFLN